MKTKTTGWICSLPLVLAWAGCAPEYDALEQVAAAAEVAAEDGDANGLEGLFCEWLHDHPSCIDLDVGGVHGAAALGYTFGRYMPVSHDVVEEGVMFGRFYNFDGQTRGCINGEYEAYDDAQGGSFVAHARSQDDAWRGFIEGQATEVFDGEGRLNGTWERAQRTIHSEIVGVYAESHEGDGGRFLWVQRADDEPTYHKLRIRSEIDGRSSLVIGTYQAFYHHDDHAAPGMHFYFGQGDSTSEPARPTFINDREWYPQWPEDGENRDCNCESSVFQSDHPHDVLVPYDDSEVSLTVVEGRGEVTIVEQPSRDNGYHLTLEWDDNPFSGPAWYEVELDFVTY